MKSIKELRNEVNETYNPIGQFKVKKTKQKTIDVPDDDTLEEFGYDIIRSGKKVGEIEELGIGTIYGKLYGKDLPELSSYKGKNPEQKLQSFLKSKTGARWAKNVKELSDIIGESKQEDIADLKALLKNPDPKVAKNYGGIEGYKKMIQSKIDKLMKEETELTEAQKWDPNLYMVVGIRYDGTRVTLAKQKGSPSRLITIAKKHQNDPEYIEVIVRSMRPGDIWWSSKNKRESAELEEETEKGDILDIKSATGGTMRVKVWKVDDKSVQYTKVDDKDQPTGGRRELKRSMFDKLVSEDIEEAMSRAARIKRSKIMKRLQPKIKKAKERAAKKKASSDVIDKRAEKQAKEVLIKKWLKGKSKSDVPFAERERIEGKLKKSKKAVDRIKKKFVKDIRKQEAGKLTKKESTELDENKRTIPDDYIDFMDDDKSWIAVKATNSGEDAVRGEIAKKNWPTGAPVTKTFTKGTAQIPDGEFWVIIAKKYWYWKQDNGKWAAFPRKGATPPFDY